MVFLCWATAQQGLQAAEVVKPAAVHSFNQRMQLATQFGAVNWHEYHCCCCCFCCRFPTWSATITAPGNPSFNTTFTVAQLNATLLYAYNSSTPITTPPSAAGSIGSLRRVGPVLAKN
jgi:hypothetical protein